MASRSHPGNLYFSNWECPALHALVGSGAAPCVVRITAERTLDADWQPDLTSCTDGRRVMNFRYLRDGKAIGAVLHHVVMKTIGVRDIRLHWPKAERALRREGVHAEQERRFFHFSDLSSSRALESLRLRRRPLGLTSLRRR